MRYLPLLPLLLLGLSLAAQPQPFTQIFGEAGRFEQGAAVVQTSGGQIFFTGTADADSQGGFDVWLACFEADGTPRWARAYGSPVADYAQGLWLVGDSLLLVAGNRYDFDLPRQQAFLMAIDTAGTLRWVHTYGDSLGNASFKTVVPLPGGDLIASGYRSDPAGGGNDSYVVRLDPAGHLRWVSPLRDSLVDVAHSALPGPAGSVIVVGDQQQPAGHYNAYAARLDSLGQVEWMHPFLSPLNGGAQSLVALRDSTYLMIGESVPDTTTSRFDYYLVCFTAAGTERWRRYLGGPGGDAAFAGFQGPDGDLYLAGYGFDSLTAQTDVLVMRCDSTGSFKAQRYYGGPGIEHGYGMVPARDGGYLVAGFSAQGIDNQFLLVYDSLAVATTAQNPTPPAFQLWPQPVAAGGRLHWPAQGQAGYLRLVDAQGRQLYQGAARADGWEVPAHLTPGRYWVELRLGPARYFAPLQVE